MNKGKLIMAGRGLGLGYTIYKCKKLQFIYTVLTATDQKPQKIIKRQC